MRILKYPHPALRHEAKPLRRVDAALKKIVGEMLDLMYHEGGVGLAATQVAVPYRMFVMNIQADPEAKDHEFVFINPEITKRSGTIEVEEGCLSLPDIFGPVKRAEKIVLAAYNLKGEELSYEMSGLVARTAQHEYDHLDGVLFIDRLGPSHQLVIKQELADLELAFQGDRDRGLIGDDRQIASHLAELEALRT